MAQSDRRSDKAIRTILGVMLQVGVVTVVIVLVSVFGGLWLDERFGTKPLFTAVLVISGIPITIIVLYRIARGTSARIAKSEENNSSES